MSKAEEQEQLIEIKAVVASLPREFSLGADLGATCLLAPALDGNGHDIVARLEPALTFQQQQAIQRAPQFYRFLLGLLERAKPRVRDLEQELNAYRPPPLPEGSERKPPNYAAEVAMKCESVAFRRYLREVHELPDTADAERINTRVRTLLKIQSRAELNTDPDAAARWQSLKKDFDRWMRT